MKTNISKLDYINKYDRIKTIQVHLKLNIIHDHDIIIYLNHVDNKQGKIKELIRKDIQKHKNDL